MAYSNLRNTTWLTGPKFLQNKQEYTGDDLMDTLDSTSDPEVRPLATMLHTVVKQDTSLGSKRFKKFSS